MIWTISWVAKSLHCRSEPLASNQYWGQRKLNKNLALIYLFYSVPTDAKFFNAVVLLGGSRFRSGSFSLDLKQGPSNFEVKTGDYILITIF